MGTLIKSYCPQLDIWKRYCKIFHWQTSGVRVYFFLSTRSTVEAHVDVIHSSHQQMAVLIKTIIQRLSHFKWVGLLCVIHKHGHYYYFIVNYLAWCSIYAIEWKAEQVMMVLIRPERSCGVSGRGNLRKKEKKTCDVFTVPQWLLNITESHDLVKCFHSGTFQPSSEPSTPSEFSRISITPPACQHSNVTHWLFPLSSRKPET